MAPNTKNPSHPQVQSWHVNPWLCLQGDWLGAGTSCGTERKDSLVLCYLPSNLPLPALCTSPFLCPLRLPLSFTCEEWGGGPIRLPSVCPVGETSWLAGVVGVKLGVLGGENKALSEKEKHTGFSTYIPSLFQKWRLFWGSVWRCPEFSVQVRLLCLSCSWVLSCSMSFFSLLFSTSSFFWSLTEDCSTETDTDPSSTSTTGVQQLQSKHCEWVDWSWFIGSCTRTHRLCLSPTGRESGNTRGSARRSLGPASAEWMPGWKIGRQWHSCKIWSCQFKKSSESQQQTH